MASIGHSLSGPRLRKAAPAATIVLAVAVAGAALAVALTHRSGAGSLQDRVHAIAADFRCPVCGNLSVADSGSSLAQQMRGDIGDRLRAGQTPSQIRAFYASRYGQWISLSPPGTGLATLVWALPVAALVAGALAVGLALRRRSRAPPAPSSVTAAERARIRRELEALEEPE